MNSIELQQRSKAFRKPNSYSTGNIFTKLGEKYINYTIANSKERVFWYMKAIIIIPCVIMVPSIIIMYWFSSFHEIYAGLCMILFFSNIILHLANAESKIYIPFYHITIAIMFIFPSITYLISQ